MFLHIGLNTVLDVKDIIAIINMDSVKCAGMYSEKNAVNISNQKPKSLIFFDDGTNRIVYLSPISSLTLKKRIDKYHIYEC